MTFYLRWLFSKAVRQATEFYRQAQRLLEAQRDLLSEKGIEELQQAILHLKAGTREGVSKDELQSRMTRLEEVANAWLKPYPNAALRENIEVFLVAGAVALAFRTFFLQPMAIPSGSAQPTFWGIIHEDSRGRPDVQFPSFPKSWIEYGIKGTSYYHVVAQEEGTLRIIDEKPRRVFLFLKNQRIQVGSKTYTIWSPPEDLLSRGRLLEGQPYRKGDDIIKLKVVSGDHLFVDRFTYNFRQPKRGETIVFLSQGVPGLIPDTHYIKRLVAIGGETVRLGNDRHLVINERRLDASDPGFEHVYGPSTEARVDHYSGHANGLVSARAGRGGLASLFPDEKTEFRVRPNHYLTMGDNTLNSFDSRDWGDFPREKAIGRSCFVFWPITDRFGWGSR